MVKIRRAYEVLFLGLFLFFLLITDLRYLKGWPVSLFLEATPLVALATALTTHTIYRNLVWGLVVIAITMMLGRVWCNWMCPFGIMHHFFGWIGNRRNTKQLIEVNRYRKIYAIKYYILAAMLAMASLWMIPAALDAPGKIVQAYHERRPSPRFRPGRRRALFLVAAVVFGLGQLYDWARPGSSRRHRRPGPEVGHARARVVLWVAGPGRAPAGSSGGRRPASATRPRSTRRRDEHAPDRPARPDRPDGPVDDHQRPADGPHGVRRGLHRAPRVLAGLDRRPDLLRLPRRQLVHPPLLLPGDLPPRGLARDLQPVLALADRPRPRPLHRLRPLHQELRGGVRPARRPPQERVLRLPQLHRGLPARRPHVPLPAPEGERSDLPQVGRRQMLLAGRSACSSSR